MQLLKVVLCLIFITGCSVAQTTVEVSDHYDGDRFYNLNSEVKGRKSLYDVLKWKLGETDKGDDLVGVLEKTSPDFPSTIDSDEVYVTFINHATALIQVNGLNILTDPVFSDYIGPFSLFGFRRSDNGALSLSDLPKIDLVLISHNHYDHLDLPSIRQILERDNPLYIVPLKNGPLLADAGVQKIVELDWWESFRLSPDHNITLTPAQHWSARGLFDDCKSLWGGFLIKSRDLKIFFAGDTGYATHFEEIFNRFGAIDVSLLPIGCYKPRWFMRDVHMDPEDAVTAHLDLHSSYSIGIHFGTFKLADDSICQPVADLEKALSNRAIAPSQFIAPLNGQTMSYRKQTNFQAAN